MSQPANRFRINVRDEVWPEADGTVRLMVIDGRICWLDRRASSQDVREVWRPAVRD